MKRALLLFFALAALPVGAATISSTTCTTLVTTGCVTLDTSSVANVRSVTFQVSGTWVGTLQFEGSLTGVDYTAIRAYPVGGGTYGSTTSANGFWQVDVAGLVYIRLRATDLSSGVATVVMYPTAMTSLPDVVRAVGPTFGSVEVSGAVGLTGATLAAMGNVTCVVAEAHRHSLTTTPEIIPANLPDGGTGAIEGRSSWSIMNLDTTTKKVSCRKDPGDGGLPDCNTPGFGFTILPNGGNLTIPVRQSDTMRCMACVSGAVVEHTEQACTIPENPGFGVSGASRGISDGLPSDVKPISASKTLPRKK